MSKLVLLGLGSLAQGVALGEESGLPIEAMTSVDPQGDVSAGLVLLLLCLLGVLLSMSVLRVRPGSGVGPLGGKLFLNLRFQVLTTHPGESTLDQQGHVLDLSLRTVTFVSSRFVAREARLRFNLGSLPDFPEHEAPVEAQVVSCRNLGGDPESYLVTARFIDLRPENRGPLARYLQALTQQGELSHA